MPIKKHYKKELIEKISEEPDQIKKYQLIAMYYNTIDMYEVEDEYNRKSAEINHIFTNDLKSIFNEIF